MSAILLECFEEGGVRALTNVQKQERSHRQQAEGSGEVATGAQATGPDRTNRTRAVAALTHGPLSR
ncbi:hypothetical protein ACRRTK_021999 [Alexandromys fortis]